MQQGGAEQAPGLEEAQVNGRGRGRWNLGRRGVEGIEGKGNGVSVTRLEGELRKVRSSRPEEGLTMDRAIGTDRLATEGAEGRGIPVDAEDEVVHGEDVGSFGRSHAELGGNAVGVGGVND